MEQCWNTQSSCAEYVPIVSIIEVSAAHSKEYIYDKILQSKIVSTMNQIVHILLLLFGITLLLFLQLIKGLMVSWLSMVGN